MKIEVTDPSIGCYGRLYEKGEILDYEPWPHTFRGMEDPQRIANGIYVFCQGHGEFDVVRAKPVQYRGAQLSAEVVER